MINCNQNCNQFLIGGVTSMIETSLNQNNRSKGQKSLAKNVSKELRLSSASLPNHRSSSWNFGKGIRKSASTHLKTQRSESVASNARKRTDGVFVKKVECLDPMNAYFSDDDQKVCFSQSKNVINGILSVNKSNSDTNLADAEDFHNQSSHNLIQSRKTVWSLSSLTIKMEESPMKTVTEKIETGSGDFKRNVTRIASGPLLSTRAKTAPKSRLPRRAQSFCSKSTSRLILT